MEASSPSFLRPRSYDDYYRDLDSRIRESNMDAASAYSFIGVLSLSRHSVFEFPAQINTIRHHETVADGLARASLSLLLLDSNKSPLIALDAETEDGIITPATRRISNAEFGNIGVITNGYFISPHLELSLAHDAIPRLLSHTS